MDTTTRAVRRPHGGRLLAALTALAIATTLALGTAPVAQAKPRETGSAPSTARAAAATPSAVSGPVTGTLQDGTGAVDGNFNVIKFAHRKGKLVAIGKLTGTVTDAAGKVRVINKKVAMPLATAPAAGADQGPGLANQLTPKAQKQLAADQASPNAAAAAAPLSCQVLDLVLGPLDLNLLGLKVHLDTVHLNITAVGGAGNLLGNLLCAVAGLLDGSTGLNGILNGITTLLNQLLAVLG